jgi:hypothetical protein
MISPPIITSLAAEGFQHGLRARSKKKRPASSLRRKKSPSAKSEAFPALIDDVFFTEI